MYIHERELVITAKPGPSSMIAFQPVEEPVLIKSFKDFDQTIQSVSLLGSDRSVDWELADEGLWLNVDAPFNLAAVYKVEYGH